MDRITAPGHRFRTVLRRLFTRQPASPPPQPGEIELAMGDATVRVQLRRSTRASRYTLRIKGATGEVVLTMPARGRVATAETFAARHAEWIAARLARRPKPVPFIDGALVPLRGVPHRIVHRGGRGTARIENSPEGSPPTIAVAGPPEHLARRVRDFLIAEARRDLREAVSRHAAALGVTVARLQVKDTTSRWGSCSAQGVLAFSWRIVMAPRFVLDYLAAHEVAHRREMNHSARYWATLRGLFPRTDEAEAWLKAHGQDLHRYGRPATD